MVRIIPLSLNRMIRSYLKSVNWGYCDDYEYID